MANPKKVSSTTLDSGGTPSVDFGEVDIVTGTLTTSTTLAIVHPVLDKVVLLKITGGGQTFALPASCTIVGGGSFDSAAVNYVYLHCVDEATPAYLATISQGP